MRKISWLIAILSCLAAQADDKVRTWTDVNGRAMQAQFVREVDGDATFLKEGKLVTMPLDRLSDKDQKLIRELEAGKRVEQDQPPAGALTRDNGATVDQSAATKSGDDKSRPSLANEKVVAENREWQDTSGKKTTGKFVRLHQGNVVLTRLGRVVSLPFDSLSREDQRYVRDFLAARGDETPLPPASADNPPAPQVEAFAAQPEAAPFAPPPAAAPPSAIAPRAGFREPAAAPFSRPGGGGGGTNRAMELAEQARQRNAEFAQKQAQDNAQRREQAAAKVAEMSRQTHEAMRQSIQRQVDANHNELVAECGNCKKELTRDQSQLTQCPHCGVYWTHEVDQFGNKHEIPGGVARAEVQAQQDPKFAANRRPGFYTKTLTIILSSIALIGGAARLLIYLSR